MHRHGGLSPSPVLVKLRVLGDTMEVDFVTSPMQGEDAFEVDESYQNDNPYFEGETCGICMNAIIDRGVLDCCQHRFCFSCIDNWATITNLCPLCQNEFQMITCVPVYDTIGSSKARTRTQLIGSYMLGWRWLQNSKWISGY